MMKTNISNQKLVNEITDQELRQKQTNLTLLPIQIAYILVLVANALLVGGTIALILWKLVLVFVVCYITAFILLCVAIYLMLRGMRLVRQVLNIPNTGLLKV